MYYPGTSVDSFQYHVWGNVLDEDWWVSCFPPRVHFHDEIPPVHLGCYAKGTGNTPHPTLGSVNDHRSIYEKLSWVIDNIFSVTGEILGVKLGAFRVSV